MPPEEKIPEVVGAGGVLDPENGFRVQYPSFRDYGMKSVDTWLAGKRQDDGAEGLWRLHDKLYDLTTFMDSHPGGKMLALIIQLLC